MLRLEIIQAASENMKVIVTDTQSGTSQNLYAGGNYAQNTVNLFKWMKAYLPSVLFRGLRGAFIQDKIDEVEKKDKDFAELLKRQLRDN